MKKFFFVIGLSLGAYALSSAQSAATSPSMSTNPNAPKAACCQKGGETKACCAKDAKTTTATAGCAGHDHSQKAEATPAAATTDNKGKSKGKAVKTSSL